jgi:hypothetical protein
LIITANGIAMGYNKKSDGVWVNAVAIDSTGNASLKGSLSVADLTAGTISAEITSTNNVILSTAGKLYTAGKISATDPTAGVFLGHDGGGTPGNYDFAVGDGTKSIVWDGSAGTFTITNVNIETNGILKSTGGTLSIDITAAIVGQPATASVTGVVGRSTNGYGTYGKSTNSTGAVGSGLDGVAGDGTRSGVVGNSGVIGIISDTGVGIRGYGSSIGVFGQGAVGGTFSANASTGIALQGKVGNTIVGDATNTGISNLIIKEGTPGSRLDNQMIMYGALSTDADTTLGIITEQDVVSGTGAFAGILQIRIVWNGAEYWLPLQAV